MATRLEDLVVRISGDASALRREFDKVSGSTSKLGKTIERDFRRVESVARSMRNALIGVFAGGAAVSFTKSVVEAGLQLERINRALTTVTGSTGAAQREFDFVAKVADRLGLNLGAAADGYVKLTASARGTNLEGQKTRDLFEALAANAAKLSLTADQTNGAIVALSQIISKGRLSAEELRQQLGERLPGAFQAAARSLGLTTAELDKALEQGLISSELFVESFTGELQRMAGDVDARVDSMQASIERLSTAWLLAKKQVIDAGFGEAFQDAVDQISAALTNPATIEAINTLGKALADIAVLATKAAIGVADLLTGRPGLERAGNIDRLAAVRTEIMRSKRELEGIAGGTPGQLQNLGQTPVSVNANARAVALQNRLVQLQREEAQLAAALGEGRNDVKAPSARNVPAAPTSPLVTGITGAGKGGAGRKAANELARDIERIRRLESQWTKQAAKDSDLRREVLQIEHSERIRQLDELEKRGRDVSAARLAEERLFSAEMGKLERDRASAAADIQDLLRSDIDTSTQAGRFSAIQQQLQEDIEAIDEYVEKWGAASEEINELRSKAHSKAEDAIRDETERTWEEIGEFAKDTLGDAFASIALEGEASFDQLRDSFVRTLVRMGTDAAASGILSLGKQAIGSIANSGGAAGGGILGTILGAFGFAEGGIVTKPTLALIGEGQEAEGVLPLSQLRNFVGNSAPTVNIINRGQPLDVESTTRRRTGTGDEIDVVVAQSFKRGNARGEFRQQLNQRHSPGVG